MEEVKKEIDFVECRFITYIPPTKTRQYDIHMVKEKIHYTDGSSAPNIRYFKDYKRPFWLTKPSYRNHTQKKEWELEGKLNKYETPEHLLKRNLSRALEKPFFVGGLRDLCSNPFVYGADIPSTVYLRQDYKKKYPNKFTPYSLVALDIETDVFRTDVKNYIIMIVATSFNRLRLTIDKDWIAGIADPEEFIKSKIQHYIGKDYLDKHNTVVEVFIEDGELNTIRKTFELIHEEQPDFVDIFNMDFDIPKILQAIERNGGEATDILCDPCVPKQLRRCKYNQGAKFHFTAEGEKKNKPPSSQWHTLDITASYYVIDSMCSYRRIRLGEQEEPNYKLDTLLSKVLGVRKLKFDEVPDTADLRWHMIMQKQFKGEYGAYCAFDGFSLLEFEAKLKDLTITLPKFLGNSDFWDFDLQGKKALVHMADYVFKRGYVIGSIGNTEVVTSKVLSRRGWIVTLAAYLRAFGLGLKVIEEDSEHETNLRGAVADTDSVGAYPTVNEVCNVSKSTTVSEVINVKGIREETFREQIINIPCGPVNAIEFCTTMMNFPDPENLLKLYQEWKDKRA